MLSYEELQKKIENRVCTYCGEPLKLVMVENVPMIVCDNCMNSSQGTSREIYEMAEKYVSTAKFIYYESEDKIIQKYLNVNKMCGIIHYVIKGFKKG